jgi:hypothetical protein
VQRISSPVNPLERKSRLVINEIDALRAVARKAGPAQALHLGR